VTSALGVNACLLTAKRNRVKAVRLTEALWGRYYATGHKRIDPAPAA
jgi:hypothetical protein